MSPQSVGVIDDAAIRQGSAVHPGVGLEAGREMGKVRNWPAVGKFILPERGCLGSVLFSPSLEQWSANFFLKGQMVNIFGFPGPTVSVSSAL